MSHRRGATSYLGTALLRMKKLVGSTRKSTHSNASTAELTCWLAWLCYRLVLFISMINYHLLCHRLAIWKVSEGRFCHLKFSTKGHFPNYFEQKNFLQLNHVCLKVTEIQYWQLRSKLRFKMKFHKLLHSYNKNVVTKFETKYTLKSKSFTS